MNLAHILSINFLKMMHTIERWLFCWSDSTHILSYVSMFQFAIFVMLLRLMNPVPPTKSSVGIQALRGIHMMTVRVPTGMTKGHEIWFTRLPILGRSLTTIASSLVVISQIRNCWKFCPEGTEKQTFPIHEPKPALCFAETVSE